MKKAKNLQSAAPSFFQQLHFQKKKHILHSHSASHWVLTGNVTTSNTGKLGELIYWKGPVHTQSVMCWQWTSKDCLWLKMYVVHVFLPQLMFIGLENLKHYYYYDVSQLQASHTVNIWYSATLIPPQKGLFIVQ